VVNESKYLYDEMRVAVKHVQEQISYVGLSVYIVFVETTLLQYNTRS